MTAAGLVPDILEFTRILLTRWLNLLTARFSVRVLYGEGQDGGVAAYGG